MSTFDRKRAENVARAIRELKKREERALYEGSLRDFVRGAWASMDSSEFQESWALDALCDHLEAVTRGHIKRLLINFPPRCGKSNVASIAWPAWVWAQKDTSFVAGPNVRFLCGSYNHTLALQHSNATRRLLGSSFYQGFWGDRFDLMSDQNAKSQYDTDKGGKRIATSVGGTLVGLGGDVCLVDDPHNTESVESEAEREKTLSWWKELSSTRLNDPKKSAIVVVMQRLHEEDVSGAILKGDEEYVHLMLPMRYVPKRHCVTIIGPGKIWQDPRLETREDLLWPERYGEREVKSLEQKLGPYMASGRLQQLPSPAGGGIFKEEWWGKYEVEIGAPFPHQIVYRVASLDPAYTSKQENDASGFSVYGVYFDENRNPRIVVLSAWEKWLELHGEDVEQKVGESNAAYTRRAKEKWGLVEWVAHECKRHRVNTLLIEAKASGHSVAQEIRRLYRDDDWGVRLINPGSLDKRARAYAVQHLFANGIVQAPASRDEKGDLVFRPWAKEIIDQASKFRGLPGDEDNLVDSCLTADTGIVTARGVVPISDVVVGDTVMTHKGRWRRVTDVGSRRSNHYFKLKAKSLDEIKVTGEHPALVMNVLCDGNNLRNGRKFRSALGDEWKPVAKLRARTYTTRMRKGRPVRFQDRGIYDALVLPKTKASGVDRLDIRDFWPDALADDENIYLRRNMAKIPDEIVEQVLATKGSGASCVAVGQSFGISNMTVKGIYDGTRLRPRLDATGRHIPLDYEAGWAFGLFAAEGCVHNGKVNWACDSAALTRIQAWVRNVFKRSASICQGTGTKQLTLSARAAAPLFQQFGYLAENKIVPAWMYEAPSECVQGFVDGFTHGDGHREKKSNRVTLTSTSYSLLWGVRLLLARLGVPSSVCLSKAAGDRMVFGETSRCLPAYALNYGSGMAGSAAVMTDDLIGTHIEYVTRIDEPTTVYNMSVEEDESYLTVGGVVHNCTQALSFLRETGWAMRSDEVRRDLEAQMTHKSKKDPIYPV